MKVSSLVKESYTELVHKVSWPTWSELRNSAGVVMVASIIIALSISLIDFLLEKIMSGVYGLF